MNTNTVQIRTDLHGQRPVGAWLEPLRRVVAALRRRHERRQAIAELARMPDWRLDDMGIPRGRIVEVVDGLVARRGPEEAHRAEL